MTKIFTVEVTQTVQVTLEQPDIFTEEFNQDFSDIFWEVSSDEDHIEHIAQMEARGLVGYDTFVEGYGKLTDLGIKVEVVDQGEYVLGAKDV